MLTKQNLRGIWAGIPTPWDTKGRLDIETLGENVARMCAAGVHGVYTTGTTGEVFAVSDEEFPRMVKAFLQAARSTGVLTQIGVTATDTRGAIRRAEVAVEQGADGVQTALPYWMPLTDRETIGFFVDLSRAFPGMPIVHYNTTHSKRLIDGNLYRQIVAEVPALIGAKQESDDMRVLLDVFINAPDLNHFASDWLLVPCMMLGAKGSYSSLVLVNPKLILKWYGMCERGEWGVALEIQRKVYRLFAQVLNPGRGPYCDSAHDKAWVELSGFLKGSRAVRSPYATIPDEMHKGIREAVLEIMPELITL